MEVLYFDTIKFFANFRQFLTKFRQFFINFQQISQNFHQFYNNVNILNADEKHKNNIMRTLMIVKSVIASSLHLLGIEPLENM